MKLLHYIRLTICIILTACGSPLSENSNAQTTPSTDGKVELPINFYKKLNGTIGKNLSVTMNLTKRDSAMRGDYYYDKVGIQLELSGQISSSNEITLSETNEKQEETGKFVGKFTSTETFEGIWTNPKTNKSFTFKLKEVRNNIAIISFENYNTGNEIGSSRNIDLIKISLENNSLSEKINKSIMQNIGGEDVEEILNREMNTDSEYYFKEEIEVEVVTNEADILCLQYLSSRYDEGAPHGNSFLYFINYDLKNGSEIKLEQLFIPNISYKLNQIAESEFMKIYSLNEGWDFQPGEFKLNDNFSIKKGGLLFYFNSYEIGTYLNRASVFIPYNKISDLIKTESLLWKIMEK